MNPLANSLIPDPIRTVSIWTSHNPVAVFLPLAAAGTLPATGHQVPGWLTIPVHLTAWLFLLLLAAMLLGRRVHRELDWAGVPCRFCHFETETDDDLEVSE